MRNGKFGGRGVIEEDFLKAMQDAHAIADPEWVNYRKYDPVYGDLLETYQDWRNAAGRILGRIEQYYSHGEQHYLHVVFDRDSPPDNAPR